nr:hypothetical protein [Bacilli bacterium]
MATFCIFRCNSLHFFIAKHNWDFYENIEAKKPNTVELKWINTWGIPLILTAIILVLSTISIISTLNGSLIGTIYMTALLLLLGLLY